MEGPRALPLIHGSTSETLQLCGAGTLGAKGMSKERQRSKLPPPFAAARRPQRPPVRRAPTPAHSS